MGRSETLVVKTGPAQRPRWNTPAWTDNPISMRTPDRQKRQRAPRFTLWAFTPASLSSSTNGLASAHAAGPRDTPAVRGAEGPVCSPRVLSPARLLDNFDDMSCR